MRADRTDAELKSLRSSISDLAHQIDSYKTKTAAAVGGGVFLFLLAAGAVYDLIARKSGIWAALGVTRETLNWIAIALGGSAIILLAVAFARAKRKDVELERRLERMEQEYADLLERRDESSEFNL